MPALSGDALIGSIHERKVGQTYEALSYCWTPDPHSVVTDVISIMEDGHYYTLAISLNLGAALRRLRHRSGENRFFWIDAICIDQSNAIEKSQQIPQMDKIFNDAEQVCIWLGENEDYPASSAGEYIREINEMQIFDDLVQPKYIPHWSALASLMRRPWFKRRWVVQEIAFARQAVVFWGDHQVAWRELADAIALFGAKATAISGLLQNDKPNQLRADFLSDVNGLSANRLVEIIGKVFRKMHDGQRVSRFLSLEMLMSTLTAFEVSQPHDIVYAILSLARDLIPKSEAATMSPLHHISSFGNDAAREEGAGEKPSKPPQKTSDQMSAQLGDNITSVSLVKAAKRKYDESQGLFKNDEIAKAKARLVEHRSASTLPFDYDAMERNMIQLGLADRIVSKRFWDEEAVHRLHGEPEDMDLLAHRLLFYEHQIKRLVRDALQKRVRHRYIQVDYSKQFYEVGIDFLNFVIPRSGSLDMLCRPWAPDTGSSPLMYQNDLDLPSWICPLSKSPFMSLSDGSSSRINGDLFVGMPDMGGTRYGASGITEVGSKRYFFGGKANRSLFVVGMILDTIKEAADKAVEGNVPFSWLELADWTNPLESPPDDFWKTIVADRDAKGENVPTHYQRACQFAFQQRPLRGGLNIDRLIRGKFSDVMTEYLKRVQAVIWMRRLIRTEFADPTFTDAKTVSVSQPAKGRLGLVPSDAQVGDHICILRGCTVPVVVRAVPVDNNLDLNDDPATREALQQLKFQSTGSSTRRLPYTLIGECYIHGLMDGEAFMLRDIISSNDKALIDDIVLELR